MFQRKWFFWIDRLKITRAERVSILGLLSLSILLALVTWWYEPKPLYDDDNYRELDQFFEKRLKEIEREEARIMARYRGKKLAEGGGHKGSAAKMDDRKSRPTKVNINKAGIDALQTLPGIGPALAERIVSYREQKGPFEDTGDLVKVKGIGRVTLEKMRRYLQLRPDRKNN